MTTTWPTRRGVLKGMGALAVAPLHKMLGEPAAPGASLAYRWLDVAQAFTALDVDAHGARPTVLSRTLAIFAVSMYEAWAAYDARAIGPHLGGALRRPHAEHTPENKARAVSAAAHAALVDVYPASKAGLDAALIELGGTPARREAPPGSPEAVGRAAAAAVIAARRNDGANQHGDAPACDGRPYGDSTGYAPVNPPDRIIDPDRWQPITFTRPDGSRVTPGFLTPHFGRVTPWVLTSPAQFRPGPPPTTRTRDAELRAQTDTVLRYNATLTREQKAIVEFMRDGPRSTGQSGHWLRFAQDVSRRDNHTLDQDIRLYFAVAVVAMDAFIACWETKRFYDSSRPWTLIRHYYRGQTITGWAGPAGGVAQMPADQWRPYSPESFITPPFPGYTSGHATVSGACARILERFTGTDTYGFAERRPHCALTEQSPGDLVTLELPTWTAVADMAALSRALGGYHIPVDNDVGLAMGRSLADWAWPRVRAYFDGVAPPAVLHSAP